MIHLLMFSLPVVMCQISLMCLSYLYCIVLVELNPGLLAPLPFNVGGSYCAQRGYMLLFHHLRITPEEAIICETSCELFSPE